MTGTTEHYGQGDLIGRVTRQLLAAGFDLDQLRPSQLAGMDEFHLGGAAATEALLTALDLADDARVLDVGSGVGGAARRMAAGTGRRVLGVDLTPDFVELATYLTAQTGLGDRVSFRVDDATALDVEDAVLDAVNMIHVGMNIEDKSALFAEFARVVRRGGVVGVYDIMRVGEGDIEFPVPWSSGPATSFVASPPDYIASMKQVGLEPDEPVNRIRLVRDALASAASNPPPVDLSHLMGDRWPVMFSNLRSALSAGIVAPVQIICRRS